MSDRRCASCASPFGSHGKCLGKGCQCRRAQCMKDHLVEIYARKGLLVTARAAALEETLAVVAEVRAHYPEDVFTPPPKGKAPDCYSAAGCRIACDLIREEIETMLTTLRGGEPLFTQGDSEPRTWRTLVRVVAREDSSVRVVVPGWEPAVEVSIRLASIPNTFWKLLNPGRRLYAHVNIEAEEKSELKFDRWETE